MYRCLLSHVFFSLTVSIIVGTTIGVLGLVTVLWCIAFCICMKISTCPLHKIYYKRTIQNLAEAPPVQANPGPGNEGVTTLYPPPSQTTTFWYCHDFLVCTKTFNLMIVLIVVQMQVLNKPSRTYKQLLSLLCSHLIFILEVAPCIHVYTLELENP